MICCGDKNYFSYYYCLAWTISAKNARPVATCHRCPQKMRKLLPRVNDVRKKCGNCCHASTMSAKNAEAVATCRRCPQKMRRLLPHVDDVRKKCGSCCHVSPMSAKNNGLSVSIFSSRKKRRTPSYFITALFTGRRWLDLTSPITITLFRLPMHSVLPKIFSMKSWYSFMSWAYTLMRKS